MTVGEFRVPNPGYPPGTILTWTEPLGDIPGGWAICDGNNGTPNLMDRFPKSVPDTATDPGTTGGKHKKTLSTSQLPAHSHSVTSVGNAGQHTHTIGNNGEADAGYNNGDPAVDAYSDGDGPSTNNLTWSHAHSLSVGSAGSGNEIENRQPYVEVAFIQKL